MALSPRIALTLLSCALPGAGCTSAPGLAPTTSVLDLLAGPAGTELLLGPNDVLRVGIYGRPELSAPPHPNTAAGTRIDAEGNLSLPLAGPVHVADMTISQAHVAIRAAYAPFVIDPRVDVSVIEYAARRFYLLGEVEHPGAYAIDRPLTLYQALALGGRLTSKADRERVVLLRGGPEDLQVAVFDFEQPRSEGFARVRPDDLVFVCRSNAGKFTDELLPYLTGISSSLSSAATLLLIEDQLND